MRGEFQRSQGRGGAVIGDPFGLWRSWEYSTGLEWGLPMPVSGQRPSPSFLLWAAMTTMGDGCPASSVCDGLGLFVAVVLRPYVVL